MKRLSILAVLLLMALGAEAAVRLGLGQAVAKRSAELINQAGAPVTGEGVAATLPICAGNEVFDSLPTEMSMIGGIDPLGHVQPTGHTFSTDHIYYYSSTMTAYTPAVYAPGNIHITEVDTTEYLNASPVFTDYSVTFYPCRNLRAVYAHIRTLSTTILNQIGTPSGCSTYSTGGNSFRRCSVNTNIVLGSGDVIGAMATSGTLDFGLSDDRVSLRFANPARHLFYQSHVVCPIDYFTAGPKTTMEAKLGRFDGGYRRVTPPICGVYNHDVAATAKGSWYHVGSPDSPEDPHLALIDNNVYAPQQTISVGNALPNGGGMWVIFSATSAGQVNRDFAQVTADGTVYCYDTFFDPLGQPAGTGYVFILQMPTSTTLRFEKQTAGSCGAGPWSFTSNAVNYQR